MSDLVKLDLNNPVFQQNLFALQKLERHAVLDALKKLRQLSWDQVYRDAGLKWEKIVSVPPPAGVDVLYSLRISKGSRALAYREGVFVRFLSICSDHDTAYGKK